MTGGLLPVLPMRFDERFLDEIKSRLRPSDVIGKTVKLRKLGREFVGLSPLQKEKTPSFYVNDEKGMFFRFKGFCQYPGYVGFPFIYDARSRNRNSDV